MNKKVCQILYFISILLFVLSLSQEPFILFNSSGKSFSLPLLLFGWFGIFEFHLPAFIWLANPILFLSWIFFKKKFKSAFKYSALAFLLMLSFLFVDEILDFSGSIIKREILYLGLGYWLWLSSGFIMLIASLLKYNSSK